MFADSRERKMLVKRNSEDPEDVQSYEDYKRKQDKSYLDSGISGSMLDTIGNGVTKTGQMLKELWYNISTPRWKQDEERKKKNASQK